MSIAITVDADIAERMHELGCPYPRTGIALLPINFVNASSATDLRQASDTATVKKLLKEAEVPIDDLFVPTKRPIYIKNKSAEWAAPIVFVSAAFYSQNPAAVSLALNVIGNYTTDFAEGTSALA